MVRSMSACPRAVIAVWQWLAGGWSRMHSRTTGGATMRAFVAADAPGPNGAETAPQAGQAPLAATACAGNLKPASPHMIKQSAAWLELMAQINHDLRTPLNAVIGFSDVMSSELLGPVGHPRYREYACDIRDSGRRLLKAAEDTLAVTALLTPAAREPARAVPIAEMAAEIWTHFAAESGNRDITFALTAGAEDVEILGQPHPLRQALVNLMSEAASRCRDCGQIRLLAIAEDETVRLELSVPNARSRAELPAGSLAINLARTLLDLQGAGLIEVTGTDGTWRAVTILDRAVQRDFFQAAGWGVPQPLPAVCA